MEHIKIDPNKENTDVILFDGASNVQLGGDPLNMYDPKLTVMCGIGHTASILFNDVAEFQF